MGRFYDNNRNLIAYNDVNVVVMFSSGGASSLLLIILLHLSDLAQQNYEIDNSNTSLKLITVLHVYFNAKFCIMKQKQYQIQNYFLKNVLF